MLSFGKAWNLILERPIDPKSGIQNTTDSLVESSYDSCNLALGVRVDSASLTDEGLFSTVSGSTTAGVVLRNPDGQYSNVS